MKPFDAWIYWQKIPLRTCLSKTRYVAIYFLIILPVMYHCQPNSNPRNHSFSTRWRVQQCNYELTRWLWHFVRMKLPIVWLFCFFVCLSVYLSLCLFVCLLIFQSVSLFVFVCFRFVTFGENCSCMHKTQWVHAPPPPQTLSIASHQVHFLLQNHSRAPWNRSSQETSNWNGCFRWKCCQAGCWSRDAAAMQSTESWLAQGKCTQDSPATCGSRCCTFYHCLLVCLFVFQPTLANCLLNPWMPIICRSVLFQFELSWLVAKLRLINQ